MRTNWYWPQHPFYSPDDVNSTAARPEPEIEWPEGDMPEQMGGARTTIMPGIHLFRLPTTLATLWHPIVVKDGRPKLADGSANPTFDKPTQRQQLKFDRNNPLVVVGGQHDGDSMTWTCTTNPRVRGRKDDPKSPWISDAAYLHTVGLADARRVKTTEELKANINSHGGQIVRLETGLSAQCRPDRPRRIRVTMDGQATTIDDPSGKKGCGTRYYTDVFRNPQTGHYDLEVACDCGQPSPDEVAAGHAAVTVVLRGYENVERILPPITGPAAGAVAATTSTA